MSNSGLLSTSETNYLSAIWYRFSQFQGQILAENKNMFLYNINAERLIALNVA